MEGRRVFAINVKLRSQWVGRAVRGLFTLLIFFGTGEMLTAAHKSVLLIAIACWRRARGVQQ